MQASPSVKLFNDWHDLLLSEFSQPYMQHLRQFLNDEKAKGKRIYPKGDDMFNALNSTSFEATKVVILGQDPYHGASQAHGLAFSVNKGIPTPPSLINIYKELESDLGIKSPNHGYLQEWATQGVLLLNGTLSVEAGAAGSHQNKGWEQFTDSIIKHLNRKESPLVFILWGAFAQKKASFVDTARHCILKSVHPSPLSASRGFFGGRYFSKTNQFLEDTGQTAINWQLST